MTRREKFFLVIIAALTFAFFENNHAEEIDCSQPEDRSVITPDFKGKDTTAEYLSLAYSAFNGAYFNDSLPKDVRITLDETDSMGSTDCTSNNFNCTLKFNLHYVASRRYADLTLLHEMCHIPTYEERVPGEGQIAFHGPKWRACMLQLDMQGAFRYLLIDGYDGNRGIVTGGFK